MLTGHQEGQCIVGLEADCGVSYARLWERQIPKVRGVEAQR